MAYNVNDSKGCGCSSTSPSICEEVGGFEYKKTYGSLQDVIDNIDKPYTAHTVNALKDSGARETFSTGAQRDRQPGKGKPSLVPSWVIWLVSRVYEDGAAKYASRNWEKGMPLSNYIDSAERHLTKLKAGMRDEPHATQVIWNMIGYIYTSVLMKMNLRPAELNDMPNQLAELSKDGEVATAEPLSDYEYKSIASLFDVKF